MAEPAIDLLQIIGMWKTFIVCIGMTGEAAVAMVDTVCKNGGIYKHGYGSSLKHSGQLSVLMTHHAILVGLCM